MEESTRHKKSESLITRTHVQAALTADKGTEAQLLSWTVHDFTKKGDNYATDVTSIKVKYLLEGTEDTVTYIVKLNPRRPYMEDMTEFWTALYQKETGFYNEILPLLTSQLPTGDKSFQMPKCFHTNSVKDEEMIFLEDLRPRGFLLHDRRKGMDAAHTDLVLKELARLHAASVLLQVNQPQTTLLEKFDYLKKDWTTTTENSKQSYNRMFSFTFMMAAELLEKVGGHGTALQWVQMHMLTSSDIFDAHRVINPPFEVICHGDCWSNNVLYRYSDSGDPIEVMLVDLQQTRVASPATDLAFLLYNSVHGDVRKANLDTFLATYHRVFCEVLEAAGTTPPFTLEELRQELKDRRDWGRLFALVQVMMIYSDPDDIPSFDDVEPEDIPKVIEEMRLVTLKNFENIAQFRSRFLAIFNDIDEN